MPRRATPCRARRRAAPRHATVQVVRVNTTKHTDSWRLGPSEKYGVDYDNPYGDLVQM